jgi:hypothetical protein
VTEAEKLRMEFDAGLSTLQQALLACPDERWETSVWHVPRTDPWVWPDAGVEPVPERTDESIQRYSAFCIVAYHCLWFLEYYAEIDAPGVSRFEPVIGGPEEQGFAADGAVAVPRGSFSKPVLLGFLEHGRRRLDEVLQSVTSDDLDARCPAGHVRAGTSLRELLRVNLAHVREHGAQLLEFAQA